MSINTKGYEFKIHDRDIGIIDHATDFRDLIKKLACHMRFYKNPNKLGFSTKETGDNWSWNLEVLPKIAQEYVKQMHVEFGNIISDEAAMRLAKETILELTGGIPLGFDVSEVKV